MRLVELALAETAAAGGKNAAGHFQGNLRERQESDFGHRPPAPTENTCRSSLSIFQNLQRAKDVNRAKTDSKPEIRS